VTEDFIAKRVALLRLQKGVSARDMSLSLGQSESYINKIENKKAQPSINGLYYICEYFGITPAEFFDEGNAAPDVLRGITSNLKLLTSDQLSMVASLIKELKKR